MSISFGSFIAFLLMPAIGSFLLGLVFFGRLKIIRYILWTISGLLLILIILSKINHEINNKSESLNYIGQYKLDVLNSKYDSLNLEQFSNLILTVKDNYTFNFNRQTPFFPSLTGHWSFDDDGEFAFIEYTFDNHPRNFQLQASIRTWIFESYNAGLSNRLVFANTDTLWQQKLK